VFIFVLPGLMAYILSQKGMFDISSIQTLDASGKTITETKGIYTLMITQLVPTGLVGVLVAALLSGLMSQISGALNSIATLASFDLYKRFNPEASDKKMVSVGKISAAIALLVSILLLPLLNRYESLFNGINDVIAHIAPPITTVFVLGIFWKKASAKAAQLTLWIGSLLGGGVFAINKLTPGTMIAGIPFMMMAFYLFIACVLMQVVFSFIYPVQHTKESEELYWKSLMEPLKGAAWKGVGNYKFLSLLLIVIMGLLYWMFK
jgi:SSS family solute:Na+ symporter